MTDRSDQYVVQGQAVVQMPAFRLAGSARPMKGTEEPVSASITCKHSSSSVGPVGGRSKANDEAIRRRIAKMRDRKSPVVFQPVG